MQTGICRSLVSGLFAQQEPRIRESGENFTYAALECLDLYTQIPQKLGELMAEIQIGRKGDGA